MTSNPRINRECDATTAKPVETFWLREDPITGERFDVPEPAQYRKCIPVYDRDSGELREFIL